MSHPLTVLYDELGFIEPHGGVSRLFTNLMRRLPPDIAWRLTPVATRNAYLARASCFPEVAADAALYFTLDDEDDFRAQLRPLLDPASPLRASLIAKGRARVQNFSWTKCAAETTKVYRLI